MSMLKIRTDSRVLRQLDVLRWTAPFGLVLIIIVYQLGVARWVEYHLNSATHFVAEILFYATTGSVFVFWILSRIIRWVDEKEQSDQLARASERRLASITSASADAILSLDPIGKIDAWNRGAELLFGFSKEEIIGQPFVTLFGDDQAAGVELEWLMVAVRRDGFVRGHETTCKRANGTPVDVELTATAMDPTGGTPPAVSVILRDITKRKRREEEIRALNATLNDQVAARTRELAEKVELLGQANQELRKLDQTRSELVSLVSHQIRAPLTNMQGAVTRMQAACPAISGTCGRMFDILEQQVARLDRLVRDVLNASRLEEGDIVLQREPLSVLPVIKQAAEQVRARQTGRPIHLQVKPGLPMIFADRDRVIEVLVNLLDNADKYSPVGEEVSIDVRADDTQVTLSVIDNGPGLPEQDLRRVFDKFYRIDSSDSQSAYGYGLGLYICRLLIEAQKGRIWGENRPGGGASFSFALPVWQGEHE
jgi:PAS domain S-box-containing protein